MKKILIQANNLDTVIDVLMYIYRHPGYSKQDIADFCGFSLRQVDYYTNACRYLGFLDANGQVTANIRAFIEENPADVTDFVYSSIKNDKVIGLVYSRLSTNSYDDQISFTKELVRNEFPGYSEAVYERRASNMLKWCIKILNYENKLQ